MTSRSGVYQMFDTHGKILYVGKANNLKNRLTSYFQKNISAKTAALMAQVVDVQIIVTETETEALLLECNLIKKNRPKYNVLLRDDKTYPYIFLSNDPFPRLDITRAAHTEKGRYFGPYPNGYAARKILTLMQKIFPIRHCKNSYFQHRTRPCLQYQIKRCTAPCVGLIAEADYARDVELAILFLQGKDQHVIQHFVDRMEAAAQAKHYENAALYRDKITELRHIQEQQIVSKGDDDIDVMGLEQVGTQVCVQLIKIRAGRMQASETFFPSVPLHTETAEIIESFLLQYYVNSALAQDVPKHIILPQAFSAKAELAVLLTAHAGHAVKIFDKVNTERAKWQHLANVNAGLSLTQVTHTAERALSRLARLQEALSLAARPQRIECFDVSHTQGTHTVASCVVCVAGAMDHAAYRRFNITGITPGDDYAAMFQALQRYYQRENALLPDILLIDGGLGQYHVAAKVLAELGVHTITVIGIAKGPERKAGLERLILKEDVLILPPHSEALHLLQEIRDEAHRFAITGHRTQRRKATQHSVLEDIEGIGAVKRRELLKQFGGLQGLTRASVNDLMKVKGIHEKLANKIYETLHLK